MRKLRIGGKVYISDCRGYGLPQSIIDAHHGCKEPFDLVGVTWPEGKRIAKIKSNLRYKELIWSVPLCSLSLYRPPAVAGAGTCFMSESR